MFALNCQQRERVRKIVSEEEQQEIEAVVESVVMATKAGLAMMPSRHVQVWPILGP